ncbi:MAG: glycosyltransferase [Deltaproteobacteria bacterium]|nr:glycosyltransferase [Deltaproteobacteria bacterium]
MTGTRKASYLSVVIPIYNEEVTIERLHERLSRVLEPLGKSYEVIYIDDGSTDGTRAILQRLHSKDPNVKVVVFNRNYGQHAAVVAGFERAGGEIIVTLDGDLQNPPEEIPKLLEKIQEGYDVVGGWREGRQDSLMRRFPSFLINQVTSLLVGVKMKDYGCMLRAYRREVVERICQCQEISSFIPVLANSFAGSVVEIPVAHSPRTSGRSKYTPFRLLRLNFDLLTGFSLLPIQAVSFAGILISFLGVGFAVFLAVRRLLVGPEVEGVFTLFAILFFFVGLQILALGLIGEYIGRIYMEVRRRPRYVIKEVLE